MNIKKYFEPRFSGFHDLMKYRVREILLVSSVYDAFVLEEDGRLSDKIFSEYIDLNLQFVPRITRVSSAEEAFSELKKRTYDLIITMTRLSDANPLEFGRNVKALYPDKFVVLLTYETIPADVLKKIRDDGSIDKVFYWLGNNKILLAIIKFAEDLGNLEADIRQGVQVIMVIEDSPWFYSIFLPILYTEIMKQTRYLISHAVNDLHRMLRMRARPKILLVETYEQAKTIFQKYFNNILGIISDVSFPKSGAIDPRAGFYFAEFVKAEIRDLPVLLLSNEINNEEIARSMGIVLLNKNSPKLLSKFRDFILTQFGFGDFIFRLPDGQEIGKASNLSEFEKILKVIPEESLRYHSSRNHFSIWLRARTEFELAEEIRPQKVSDFKNIKELRESILSSIEKLFARIQMGVITDFGLSKIDARDSFIKIGNGSLGGKGRGIAFINAMLSQMDIFSKYKNVEILTPHSFIICSEIFEEFLEMNQLQEFAVNTYDDQLIAYRFLQAALPEKIETNLRVLIAKVSYPLAVRSSSFLEDSQVLPFAGIFSTYMIPNNHADAKVRLKQVQDAIKLVYASVFFKSAKEYSKNANLRVEEERMAVLIQQVVGEIRGDVFYPVISGVAHSYNFYPFSHMKPDQGIASLALGLGKVIVEGGRVFRFCPSYPQMNPPYSSPQEFIDESQSHFYALDLGEPAREIVADDNFCYRKLDLKKAESDGVLDFVASTFLAEDQVIADTLSFSGPRVLTFAPILKFQSFPLAEMLIDFLAFGKKAFAAHVEIEFAINLYQDPLRKPEFYFLQIRPIVVGREMQELELEEISAKQLLCRCRHAMGNGVFEEIRDLVYVNPENFAIANSLKIAAEIGELNRILLEENKKFILIGFGRFGTNDPWLGIPLEWHQMSAAKIIIEANLEGFNIDPSQGSHFFHNMISQNLGYFHIANCDQQEFINWGFLNRQPVFQQGEFIKHLRFSEPLMVKIDGRTSLGVIFKPRKSAAV
jgi:hypothetical protein